MLKVARDPRFDDLSGELDEHRFKQSYAFLDDLKRREKQASDGMKFTCIAIQMVYNRCFFHQILSKRVSKEKNDEKQLEMQSLFDKMVSFYIQRSFLLSMKSVNLLCSFKFVGRKTKSGRRNLDRAMLIDRRK